MCQVSGVSRTAFYHWRRGLEKPSEHQKKNLKLKQEIRKIHAESRGAHGIPWITKALKAKGFEVNHKRVWRLMKEEGLQGVAHKTRSSQKTTDSEHGQPMSGNILGHQFSPKAPNQACSTDVICIPMLEELLYLPVIIDIFYKSHWLRDGRAHGDILVPGCSESSDGFTPTAARINPSQRSRKPIRQS